MPLETTVLVSLLLWIACFAIVSDPVARFRLPRAAHRTVRVAWAFTLGLSVGPLQCLTPALANVERGSKPAPPKGVAHISSSAHAICLVTVSQSAPAIPAAPPPPSTASSAESRPRSATEDSHEGVPLHVPLETADGAGRPITLAGDAPSWLDLPPVLDGPVHTMAVRSDYYPRETECWRALDRELVEAMRRYVAEYLGNRQAPMFFSWSADEIKRRFVTADRIYHERVQVSVGPMHQIHVQLQFPEEFRRELSERWTRIVTGIRLLKVVAVALGMLALIGVLFAYLRLDTVTRGYYTRRLQFLAGAAILAIVVLGLMFSRSSVLWLRWLL